MHYSHTEKAAKAEKQSKWELIEAIAEDAVENEVPITSQDSRLAAAEALAKAGNEYAEGTVHGLTLVAKFDASGTPAQRRVWRSYGWSLVKDLVGAGMSPAKVAGYLGSTRRTREDVRSLVARGRASSAPAHSSIDQRLSGCLTRLNNVLTDMGVAVHEAETSGEVVELGAYAQLAVALYHRFAESQLDTEIRQMLESETV